MDSSFHSSHVVFAQRGGVGLQKNSKNQAVHHIYICVCVVIGKKSLVNFF